MLPTQTLALVLVIYSCFRFSLANRSGRTEVSPPPRGLCTACLGCACVLSCREGQTRGLLEISHCAALPQPQISIVPLVSRAFINHHSFCQCSFLVPLNILCGPHTVCALSTGVWIACSVSSCTLMPVHVSSILMWRPISLARCHSCSVAVTVSSSGNSDYRGSSLRCNTEYPSQQCSHVIRTPYHTWRITQ